MARALAHPDRTAAPVLLNTCYRRTRPVRMIFGEADPCLNAGVARDFHEKFRHPCCSRCPSPSTSRNSTSPRKRRV
jgi:hypothetical protein